MNYFQLAEKLSASAVAGAISPADLDTVISWPIEEISTLFAAADRVRRHFFGNVVDPCTLTSIKSGGCSEDCAFCSQSALHATGVPVTGLAPAAEIRGRAEHAAANNLPFCVVSSGRRLTHVEVGIIADAIAPCTCEKHASLGILDPLDFALLRAAGVVCYNHNIETCREFFPSIVTTHTWDDRVATVKAAKAAGMRVCCGGIFGLGESWEQRRQMCLELKSLDVDTVPINFIIAIPGTRAAAPAESPLEFLKIISLFRLGLPDRAIKVCGGREADLGALQSMIFFAGANGYVTGGYLTTPGAGIAKDDAMIAGLGFTRMGNVYS
jgi:biotin synthase